jgi:hypothetical protein
MRKRYLLWLIPAACVAFGLWWPYGGQHWLAVHTGTVNEPGPYYGFWSGFGSDLGEYVIVAGLLSNAALLFRHINCHVKGCPRIGRFELAGGEYKVCGHHHPGFDTRHPTLDHMWQRHLEHRARTGGS